MMPVIFAKRREIFQPAVDVFDQSRFVGRKTTAMSLSCRCKPRQVRRDCVHALKFGGRTPVNHYARAFGHAFAVPLAHDFVPNC
jgi:hypothetical protein